MRFPATQTAVLHRNVDHRAACLALYRRLLKHTQNVTIEPESTAVEITENTALLADTLEFRINLKSIITKEFKKFTSRDFKVSKVREALKLGYKAEKCLRLAGSPNPDPVELARMTMFISLYSQPGTKPLSRLQSTNIEQPLPKTKISKKEQHPELFEIPPEYRHKPTLISVGNFPFIRYTGTKQSDVLTRALNGKLKQKIKREDRLGMLRDYLAQAEIEDEFETMLKAEAGKEWCQKNPDDGVLWQTSCRQAVTELESQFVMQDLIGWNKTGELIKRVKSFEKELKIVKKDLKRKKYEAKKLKEVEAEVKRSANTI